MKKSILISLFLLITILVIASATYFAYFYEPDLPITQESSLVQNPLLDPRFMTVYGTVSQTGKDYLWIDIIKNKKLTDYVFDNIKNINIYMGEYTVIKKYDLEKDVYSDLKISDIKIGDYISSYIDNSTSTGYRSIGIKVFSKDINE